LICSLEGSSWPVSCWPEGSLVQQQNANLLATVVSFYLQSSAVSVDLVCIGPAREKSLFRADDGDTCTRRPLLEGVVMAWTAIPFLKQ
jgi:hypothetical protein